AHATAGAAAARRALALAGVDLDRGPPDEPGLRFGTPARRAAAAADSAALLQILADVAAGGPAGTDRDRTARSLARRADSLRRAQGSDPSGDTAAARADGRLRAGQELFRRGELRPALAAFEDAVALRPEE